jgi:hypothetical protein
MKPLLVDTNELSDESSRTEPTKPMSCSALSLERRVRNALVAVEMSFFLNDSAQARRWGRTAAGRGSSQQHLHDAAHQVRPVPEISQVVVPTFSAVAMPYWEIPAAYWPSEIELELQT